MSWAKGDKSLADVVPASEFPTILAAKVATHGARVNRLIVDVAAEMADQRRQQAGEAARAARRARLAAAGVLKPRA